MECVQRLIENKFDTSERREINNAIEANPNARVSIEVNMDYVYCSVGGRTVVFRKSFRKMLNDLYPIN